MLLSITKWNIVHIIDLRNSRKHYSSSSETLDLILKSAIKEKWSEAYAKLGTRSAEICSPVGNSRTFSTLILL